MSVINPVLVQVLDEGVLQGRAVSLNFIGAGVAAGITGFEATITIPGGGGPGGLSATRVVATLPYPAKHSQSVTIIDATVSAASRILCWFSGLADSDPNSNMEDSVIINAFAGTGSFLLTINSRLPIGGNYSFDYVVLT